MMVDTESRKNVSARNLVMYETTHVMWMEWNLWTHGPSAQTVKVYLYILHIFLNNNLPHYNCYPKKIPEITLQSTAVASDTFSFYYLDAV